MIKSGAEGGRRDDVGCRRWKGLPIGGMNGIICPLVSSFLSLVGAPIVFPPFPPFPARNTLRGLECSGNHGGFPLVSPVFSQHFATCEEFTVESVSPKHCLSSHVSTFHTVCLQALELEIINSVGRAITSLGTSFCHLQARGNRLQ